MPVLTPKSYVEYRSDAYWVEGTRISLDSIVYAFQKGLSPESIVTGVLRREPTVDFQTAFAAGLQGVKDSEVLAIAAKQNRILVSHDRRTMPSEFAEFIISHQSSGAIIVSRKLSIEVILEELLLIWAASSSGERINRITKLPL
ncbi:MAG: DUF5615 family PIN-like protein [Leptolyngbyaceae cyanobacterium SM1_3_5]|nr:DUF5615 family PIN-like protein [Leptolyngbyaceae cyanobacterium SM1_3_5]